MVGNWAITDCYFELCTMGIVGTIGTVHGYCTLLKLWFEINTTPVCTYFIPNLVIPTIFNGIKYFRMHNAPHPYALHTNVMNAS